MKLYLDLCCFNRPYDDQTQARVRLETEAVILLLSSLLKPRVVPPLTALAILEKWYDNGSTTAYPGSGRFDWRDGAERCGTIRGSY